MHKREITIATEIAALILVSIVTVMVAPTLKTMSSSIQSTRSMYDLHVGQKPEYCSRRIGSGLGTAGNAELVC
jgi:hypothetical protein